MKRVAQVQPEILTAPADAIEAALDLIDESGGGAVWLERHGLSAAELARLRAHLLTR